MVRLIISHDLPFATATVGANGKTITIENMLVDTGSASTIFRTDDLEKLDIFWQMSDELKFMRGISGREAVIEKLMDFVAVGGFRVDSLTVEMGALDYGFSINGILGMDFLLKVGAVIDLAAMEIRKA